MIKLPLNNLLFMMCYYWNEDDKENGEKKEYESIFCLNITLNIHIKMTEITKKFILYLLQLHIPIKVLKKTKKM